MNRSRLVVLSVLGLAAISVSCPTVFAQNTSVTTQNIGPDGSVNTLNVMPGSQVTRQLITVDGRVITQSITSDGRIFTQNITPTGMILSDNVETGSGNAERRIGGPSTLKVGLEAVAWDASQRGPLLAVAPEAVMPVWQTVLRKPQFGPDGSPLPFIFVPSHSPELLSNGQYRLPDLADYFGHRLVRLKGLSVLAPTKMVILNTKLGKPDYFADLSRIDKLHMLEASLSASQWKLLGSEAGLGANDLSRNQRELYLSSLPNPMVICTPGVVEAKPVVLSGSQRNNIRLRLNRAVASFSIPYQGGKDALYISNDSVDSERISMNYDGLGNDGATIFGQPIKSVVPNRLKAQQLDFSSPSLQAPVSLTGLKTVRDLIERIRTTTRVEIYVDGQLAKRTLWVRSADTQTVRSGDALQALCWGLTGAIRYVSEGKDVSNKGVFILTDDVEGIGSRLAKIKDWAQAAQEHLTQAQSALTGSIRKQQPMQYIGFAADDSNALGEKANKAVEEGWKTTKERWKGAQVALTDLSPQQQETIRQGIDSYEKKPSGSDTKILVDDGMVSVSVQIRPVFLVPGIGAVSDLQPFRDLNLLLPPATPIEPTANESTSKLATIPAKLAQEGILCVSPTTEDEARQIVQTAQKRGLKQVWLVLPLVPALADNSETFLAKSKVLLKAAIAEAQKAESPIKVVAGVRLFRLPFSSGQTMSRQWQDMTITGELPSEMAKRRVANYLASEVDPKTASLTRQPVDDWIAPEATAIIGRSIYRLSEVAATPGVSGIVLLDTTPPGYSAPAPSDSFASVGYTQSSRVAFIRSAGFDPIDITTDPLARNIRPQLPQNDNIPNGSKEWNQFRSDRIARMLADMYTPLRTSLPKNGDDFPIYLQNLNTAFNGDGGFSPWEKPGQSQLVVGKAPSVSLVDVGYREESTLVSSVNPVDPAIQYRHRLNALLSSNKGNWTGAVLNFSEVPFSTALEVLERIAKE